MVVRGGSESVEARAPGVTIGSLAFEPGRFATVSSYSRGINGIMIDVAHLSTGIRALTADDISFRVNPRTEIVEPYVFA